MQLAHIALRAALVASVRSGYVQRDAGASAAQRLPGRVGTSVQWSTAPMQQTASGFARVQSAGIRMDGVEERGPADREELLDALYSNPPGGTEVQQPSTDVPSHLTLRRDEDGEPCSHKMTYVDEANCIGCYNCAMVARSTFFMAAEESETKARVWSQGGDSPDVIDEAVNTCPVDCIYYVSVEDLETLEKERDARNADRSQTWGLALTNLARRAEGKGAVDLGTAAKFLGSWDESNPLFRERENRVAAKRAAAGETDEVDWSVLFSEPDMDDETLLGAGDVEQDVAAIWSEAQPAESQLSEGALEQRADELLAELQSMRDSAELEASLGFDADGGR